MMLVLAQLLLLPPAVAVSSGIDHGRQSEIVNTSITGIDAANELIALPWQDLSLQTEQETEQMVREALEGRVLANAAETLDGVVRSEWSLRLQVKNVSAQVDLATAPGFSAADREEFTVRIPHGPGWNFAVSGDIQAKAVAKHGGKTVLDWQAKVFHFGLRIMDFRVTAGAKFDAGEADRPKPISAFVVPELRVGGQGAIPVSIPVSFEVERQADGTLILFSPVADLPLGLGLLTPRLNGRLVLTLHPPRPDPIVTIQDPDSTLPTFQRLDVALEGTLYFRLPFIGKKGADFTLAAPLAVPTIPLLHKLTSPSLLALPKIWGEGPNGEPLGITPPPLAGIDYRGAALEIEDAIAHGNDYYAGVMSHLPWGNVFSLDQTEPAFCHQKKCTHYSYGVEGDSAIWTAHYLAAEAFRYAATGDEAALARIQLAVHGIKRLFDITQQIAVDPTVGAVPVTTPGLLSRFARPADYPIDFTDIGEGPLNAGERGCYYEYEDFGAVTRPPLASKAIAAKAPSPALWYGWGCGGISPFDSEDFNRGKPISRDQYAGVFMGLAYTYDLVPELRNTVRPLIEQALDFLLDHDWNIPLPPEQRIETTVLGNFGMQLAFLQVGKRVNPGKYGSVYDRYAPASELVWIPVWFGVADPMFQYFKFNLSHITLGLALYFEVNPGLRERYMHAYAMLRRATAHHRNPHFSLMRILVALPTERAVVAAGSSGSNSDISLAEEIASLLGEWLHRRDLVAGPSGLPRNLLADFQYQAQLRLEPSNVARYQTLQGKEKELSRHALPVWGRLGYGMDFMWQRHPFGVIASDCIRLTASRPVVSKNVASSTRVTPSPDAHRRKECGNDARKREAPGVDYLLPYWMGVYLGILPSP